MSVSLESVNLFSERMGMRRRRNNAEKVGGRDAFYIDMDKVAYEKTLNLWQQLGCLPNSDRGKGGVAESRVAGPWRPLVVYCERKNIGN